MLFSGLLTYSSGTVANTNVNYIWRGSTDEPIVELIRNAFLKPSRSGAHVQRVAIFGELGRINAILSQSDIIRCVGSLCVACFFAAVFGLLCFWFSVCFYCNSLVLLFTFVCRYFHKHIHLVQNADKTVHELGTQVVSVVLSPRVVCPGHISCPFALRCLSVSYACLFFFFLPRGLTVV